MLRSRQDSSRRRTPVRSVPQKTARLQTVDHRTCRPGIHKQYKAKDHASAEFRVDAAASGLEESRYSRNVFDVSRRCMSPTPSSQGSVQSNKGKRTPDSDSSEDSLPASLPAATAKLHIRQSSTSMDQGRSRHSPSPPKRPATDEPSESQHGERSECYRQHAPSRGDCPPSNKYQRHESWNTTKSSDSSRVVASLVKLEHITYTDDQNERHDRKPEKKDSKRSDSGYQSSFADPSSQLIPQHSLHLRGKRRWAGIALQPEFSPISQEQLAAEVKGIYAGLVMVEAKCMNIDAQKAAQPHQELSTEQWQALVALHRTLLYEHHDFLMATQHPSANPALLGLATKYSMPARMWKHGIHAFLEVLRHRRPHSQEYMLAFIYLAYQMISLLLETVPGFTDTWIECLGDLARYRMAIEEDREIHNVWGGVAGRWYVKAADRHPQIGRLYHHSGILERPSLRKVYLYGRALTSVVPFPNAKESLGTLCSPIVDDEQAHRRGNKSLEALVICLHARVFLGQSTELVGQTCKAALTMLESQSEDTIAAIGVPFAVTNISALLDFGPPNNIYRQLFDSALGQDILDSRPSRVHSSAFKLSNSFTYLEFDQARRPMDAVLDFCYQSFNIIIRRTPRRETLHGLLPYVHVMLIFIKSIYTLRSRLYSDDSAPDFLNDLLSSDRIDWAALAQFLNHLAAFVPISSHSRTESFADGETFPGDGVPLLEDYMIRGLVWAQWYFASNLFNNIEDDDGSRCLEDDDKRADRMTRVLYLGMTIGRQWDRLGYNGDTRKFTVLAPMDVDELESTTLSPSSLSPRSGRESSFEGDYVMVTASSPRQALASYAQNAGSSETRVGFKQNSDKPLPMSAFRKQSQAEACVNVVDSDETNWG